MQPVSFPLASLLGLDLANECLRYGAQTISLRPKTFAVLRCLIEHAQQLVSKLEANVIPLWTMIPGRPDSLRRRTGEGIIGHVTREPVSADTACLWLLPPGLRHLPTS